MDSKGKGQTKPRKSGKNAKIPADVGGVEPTEAGTSGVVYNALDIESKDGVQGVYPSRGEISAYGCNVSTGSQVNYAAVNKTAKVSKTAKRRPTDGEADGARGAGLSGWSFAKASPPEGKTVKNLDPNDGEADGARGAGLSGWSFAKASPPEGKTVKNLDDGEADGARGAGLSGWSFAKASPPEGKTVKNLDPNDGEADGARGAGLSGWSFAKASPPEGKTVKNLDPNDGEAAGARGAGLSGWSFAKASPPEGKTVKNLDPTVVVNVNVRSEREQSGNRRFIVNVRPGLLEAVNRGPGLEQSERGRSTSIRPGMETAAHEGWESVKFGSGRLTGKPSGESNVPGAMNEVPEIGGPEVIIPYVEEAGVDEWNYIGGYQTTYAAVVGTDRTFVRNGRVNAETEPKFEAMPPTSSAEPCDIGKVQPELRAHTQADDNVGTLPEHGSVFTSLRVNTGAYKPGDPKPVQADELVAQTSKKRCFSETSGTILTPAQRQKLLHKAQKYLAEFHRGKQKVNQVTPESREEESDVEAVSQTIHSRRTVSAHAGTRTRSESRKRNREYDNKSNIGTPAMKKGRQSAEPMDTTEKPNLRSQSLCRIPSTPMEHDGEDGAAQVSEHPPRKSRDRRTHNQIERSEGEARMASAGSEVVHRVVSNTKSLSPMDYEIPQAAEEAEAVSGMPYIIIDYNDLFSDDEAGETLMLCREHVMSGRRDESTATSELEATGDASTYDSERASETEDEESNVQSVQEELLDILRPAVLLPTDELLDTPNLFEIMGSGIQADQEAEAESWTEGRTLGEWTNELKIMFNPSWERDPMLAEQRNQQQRMTPLRDAQVGGSRDLYVVKRAEIDFKRVNDSCDDGNSPGGSEVSCPGPNTSFQSRRARTPPDMIPIRVDTVLETEQERPPSSSSSDQYEGRRRREQRRTAEHRRRRRTELCIRRDEHVMVLRRRASAERENEATHYTVREANVASGSEEVDHMDVTTNQRTMSLSAPPAGGGHDGNGAGGGEMEDGRTSPELNEGSGGTVQPAMDEAIPTEVIGTDITDVTARDANLDEVGAADVKRPERDEPEDGGPRSSKAGAEASVKMEMRSGRPTMKTTGPGQSTSGMSGEKVKQSQGGDDDEGVRRCEEKVDNSDTPRTDATKNQHVMTAGVLDGGDQAPTTTVKISDALCSPKKVAQELAGSMKAERDYSDMSNGRELRADGESTSKNGRTTADGKQGDDVQMTEAMEIGYRKGASSLASNSTTHQRDLALSDTGGENDQRFTIFSPRSDSDYDSLQQPRCNTREPRSGIPQMDKAIIRRTKSRMEYMMCELSEEMEMVVHRAQDREGEVKRRKKAPTREQLTELTEERTKNVEEFRSVMRKLLDRGEEDMISLVRSTEATSVSSLGRQVTTSLTVRTEDDRSTPSTSSPLTTNSFSSTTGDRSMSHLSRSGPSSGSHAGTSASTDRDASLTPGGKHDTARVSRGAPTDRRRRNSRHSEEEEEEMDESSQEGTVTKSTDSAAEPSNVIDDLLDYSDDEEFGPRAKGSKKGGTSEAKEQESATDAEDELDERKALEESHKHRQTQQQLPISKDYLLSSDEYIQRQKNRLREMHHSSPLRKPKKRTGIVGVIEPVSRLTPKRPIVPAVVLSEDRDRDGAISLWEITNRKDTGMTVQCSAIYAQRDSGLCVCRHDLSMGWTPGKRFSHRSNRQGSDARSRRDDGEGAEN